MKKKTKRCISVRITKKKTPCTRSEKVADAMLEKGIYTISNKPVDARGLTRRDAEFVKNYLKGAGKVEAMQLAFAANGQEISRKRAAELADGALEKTEVDTAIVSALAEAGVDDALIAGKLREGLEAEAYTQAGLPYKDYRTRLGYIQTVLKVKGQMGPETVNKSQVLNYVSFKDEEEQNA